MNRGAERRNWEKETENLKEIAKKMKGEERKK